MSNSSDNYTAGEGPDDASGRPELDTSDNHTAVTAPPSDYHSESKTISSYSGETSSYRSSHTSSYRSAHTSSYSSSSYYSARSSFQPSDRIRGTHPEPKLDVTGSNLWADILIERNLIPSFADEQNWSGRGQHAEFDPSEESAIPLKFEKIIGYSQTAVVQSVLCRRVRLACKTMRCSRKMRREDIVREVEHLQKLQHKVADYHLGEFMDTIFEGLPESGLVTINEACFDVIDKKSCLRSFFRCLSKAMEYIHGKITKHMDIKPQNILVRDIRQDLKRSAGLRKSYHVYIADFGISRSYESVSESVTESPTSFTRTYAAPEVHQQESRGLSADIFSLGCVFAEMLVVLNQLWKLQDDEQPLFLLRSQNTEDQSYQANITPVIAFLKSLNCPAQLFIPQCLTISMLVAQPDERPTASNCALELNYINFDIFGCCKEVYEPLEVARNPPQSSAES